MKRNILILISLWCLVIILSERIFGQEMSIDNKNESDKQNEFKKYSKTIIPNQLLQEEIKVFKEKKYIDNTAAKKVLKAIFSREDIEQSIIHSGDNENAPYIGAWTWLVNNISRDEWEEINSELMNQENKNDKHNAFLIKEMKTTQIIPFFRKKPHDDKVLSLFIKSTIEDIIEGRKDWAYRNLNDILKWTKESDILTIAKKEIIKIENGTPNKYERNGKKDRSKLKKEIPKQWHWPYQAYGLSFRESVLFKTKELWAIMFENSYKKQIFHMYSGPLRISLFNNDFELEWKRDFKWPSKINPQVVPAPSYPAYDEGLIFTQIDLGEDGIFKALAAFSMHNGEQHWRSDEYDLWDTWRPIGDPVIKEGILYIPVIQSSLDQYILGILCAESETGKIIWTRVLSPPMKFEIDSVITDVQEDEIYYKVNPVFQGATLVVEKGAIYTTHNAGAIFRLDARDGLIEWVWIYPRILEIEKVKERNKIKCIEINNDLLFCNPYDTNNTIILDIHTGEKIGNEVSENTDDVQIGKKINSDSDDELLELFNIPPVIFNSTNINSDTPLFITYYGAEQGPWTECWRYVIPEYEFGIKSFGDLLHQYLVIHDQLVCVTPSVGPVWSRLLPADYKSGILNKDKIIIHGMNWYAILSSTTGECLEKGIVDFAIKNVLIKEEIKNNTNTTDNKSISELEQKSIENKRIKLNENDILVLSNSNIYKQIWKNEGLSSKINKDWIIIRFNPKENIERDMRLFVIKISKEVDTAYNQSNFPFKEEINKLLKYEWELSNKPIKNNEWIERRGQSIWWIDNEYDLILEGKQHQLSIINLEDGKELRSSDLPYPEWFHDGIPFTSRRLKNPYNAEEECISVISGRHLWSPPRGLRFDLIRLKDGNIIHSDMINDYESKWAIQPKEWEAAEVTDMPVHPFGNGWLIHNSKIIRYISLDIADRNKYLEKRKPLLLATNIVEEIRIDGILNEWEDSHPPIVTGKMSWKAYRKDNGVYLSITREFPISYNYFINPPVISIGDKIYPIEIDSRIENQKKLKNYNEYSKTNIITAMSKNAISKELQMEVYIPYEVLEMDENTQNTSPIRVFIRGNDENPEEVRLSISSMSGKNYKALENLCKNNMDKPILARWIEKEKIRQSYNNYPESFKIAILEKNEKITKTFEIIEDDTQNYITIDKWSIAGAFDWKKNPEPWPGYRTPDVTVPMKVVYPNEEKIQMLPWRIISAENEGVIKIDEKVLQNLEDVNNAAYLITWVYAKEETVWQCKTRFEKAGEVYFNNQPFIKQKEWMHMEAPVSSILVPVKKGWNSIFIKTTNEEGGEWKFKIEINDVIYNNNLITSPTPPNDFN